MPSYAYKCRKCGKGFSLTMSLTEHGKKRVRCPKCSSTQVGRQIESCFATTSKKS